MHRLKYRFLKIVAAFIIPCLIIVAFFGLISRAGREIGRIWELKNEVRKLDIKLDDRKMVSYELRRKKLILEMEDFKKAVMKANGIEPSEGEFRIRVK